MILKSENEGKKWTKVFSAPDDQKPLMDVLFIDANRGFAVGAYGSFYETADAGKTWKARKLLETPKAPPATAKKGKAAAVEIDDR